MDIETRLNQIKLNVLGDGRHFITTNDVMWLLNTVEKQQKEIEHLKTVEKAYAAYKSAQ